MRALRIVMREVDQPALVVPDVLAVHRHGVTERGGGTLSDAHVVLDEHGLTRAGQADHEPLMCSGWTRVVGEKPDHLAASGDLDSRAVIGEGTRDSTVVLRDGSAADRDDPERGRGDRAPGLSGP